MSHPNRTVFAFGMLLSLSTAASALASVALNIGAAPVLLPGSTAATEPDLAGTVIQDTLHPFRITNADGGLLFEAVLQARVVRSTATGLLHFAYRIRNTLPGLNGIVKNVWVASFDSSVRLRGDWRPDGLGDASPKFAQRSGGTGAMVRFEFDPARDPLVGGRDSKFFFLKTWSRGIRPEGRVIVQLVTGESAGIVTTQPGP